MGDGGLFDVNEQLVFYGSHHANAVNVYTHQICVPLIVLTAEAMLATLPTPSFFPSDRLQLTSQLAFSFNWATVIMIVYTTYYFLLFPLGAISYLPQSLGTLLVAEYLAKPQQPSIMPYIIGTHIFCWLAQFYTHAVHEKRRPSLMDNIIQAAVLAPFFVHLEGLFSLGYFSDLQKSLHADIEKKIAEFRKQEGETKKKKKESGEAR